VEWAELFHLRFMLEYVAPMVAVYEPGVLLDYFSNAWLIKVISHYPQSDLDAYTTSFRSLMDRFELPANVKVKYNVVADQLPEEELLRRALINRPMVEVGWIKLSKEQQKERLAYSERNIRWDILERDEKVIPRVLSLNQYEAIKARLKQEVVSGLGGNNYQAIGVLRA